MRQGMKPIITIEILDIETSSMYLFIYIYMQVLHTCLAHSEEQMCFDRSFEVRGTKRVSGGVAGCHAIDLTCCVQQNFLRLGFLTTFRLLRWTVVW